MRGIITSNSTDNETMYDGSAEDLPASSDRQQDSLLKVSCFYVL